jgi:hypothetical protein
MSNPSQNTTPLEGKSPIERAIEEFSKSHLDGNYRPLTIVNYLKTLLPSDLARSQRIKELEGLVTEFGDITENIREIVDKYHSRLDKAVEIHIAHKDHKIKELEDWKESAIKHTPDLQEIGKLIGVKLGDSIHDKVIPYIKSLQTQLEESLLLYQNQTQTIAEKDKEIEKLKLDLLDASNQTGNAF